MNSQPPSISPTGNYQIWAMLCHLSGIIGVGFILPLVIYFAMRRESDYVASNARAALNFHLSLLVYSLVCIPLIFVIVGIPLLIVLAIGSLILSIIAAIRASNGDCYHYPLCIPFFR